MQVKGIVSFTFIVETWNEYCFDPSIRSTRQKFITTRLTFLSEKFSRGEVWIKSIECENSRCRLCHFTIDTSLNSDPLSIDTSLPDVLSTKGTKRSKSIFTFPSSGATLRNLIHLSRNYFFLWMSTPISSLKLFPFLLNSK